jgi:hypothetical protein
VASKASETAPGAKLCAGALTGSPYAHLVPGADSGHGPAYFEGTPEEREAHADTMDVAGRAGVTKLLARYADTIPSSQPVLEIGPFLRPLTQVLAKNHKWLVWEFDQAAAQKIADSHNAEVFRVDLNQLDGAKWDLFLADNRSAISQGSMTTLNIGAAILSSVLNYIDYEKVLSKVIENLADGGLLIIGNSNVGDKKMMRGLSAPNGSQILEYLLVRYSDQIEILPGTRIFLDSFEGSRTGIDLVARFHKSEKIAQADLNLVGMDIYTTFRAAPFSVKYPSTSDESKAYIEYWWNRDPAVVAQALADIRADKHKYQNNYPRNRLAEIAYDLDRRKQYIADVLRVEPGSKELHDLKLLLSEPTREFFLPERHILIEALDLEVSARPKFVREKIDLMLRQLRHRDS